MGEFQICSKSVLDTTAKKIIFDENGISNYAQEFEKWYAEFSKVPNEVKKENFLKKIEQIKEAGLGKKYDSVLGLSGGVDSTYMAYMAWKNGLRPLIIHFDNGWNSELAVQNIENIIKTCGFDLYTYVIDWEEFKDLQLAYFKASVIDLEVPTDHFIFATLYKLAAKHKIRYILNGYNNQTESIMPQGWNYAKNDLVNILDIHKKFGTISLKRFPKLGFLQRLYFTRIRDIRSVTLIDDMEYNKADAKELIKKEFQWRDYGGKHYESVWTKFYQAYILPTKFNIDKRKCHLSNLILTKQKSREEALAELEVPLYTPQALEEEKAYVLKKFGLTEESFQDLMKMPEVLHTHYDTESKHTKKYQILEKILLSLPFRVVYKFLRITKIW
jgi:N-acetyl sugar amidotransferase